MRAARRISIEHIEIPSQGVGGLVCMMELVFDIRKVRMLLSSRLRLFFSLFAWAFGFLDLISRERGQGDVCNKCMT